MDAETKPPEEISPLFLLVQAAEIEQQPQSNHSIQQPALKQAQVEVKASAPPDRTRAEQRRREALEESLTDYLPIENLRAVERMNGRELEESKNLLRCFLSGRATTGNKWTSADKSHEINAKEEKGSKYIDDYQHDMNNLTTAYLYTHDSSLPLPKSLPRQPHVQQKIEATKPARDKKRQKTKNKSKINADLLTAIDFSPLLLNYSQPSESRGTEEDGKPKAVISNVPAIVNVEEKSDVMDDSIHSSVVADEASTLASNPAFYSFTWDPTKKGWECNRCRSVTSTFKAANGFVAGSSEPNPRLMHSHKQSCLETKADLSRALNVMLNISRTSNIKFKHITSAEFQSVVRIATNGDEEIVALFTTDFNNRWIDPVKYRVPSANIDWSKYPVKYSLTESKEPLIAAFVAFTKKMGLGFDFIANEHFIELFKLISPECHLPTPDDLITRW